jgi:hypothetical protein
MQYVYRHPSHLAGISHPNKHGKDRVRLARHLCVGTPLVLKLEPDNPADQDAVLVYRYDDLAEDLGYLYSYTARFVAKKMRCGASYSAEVASIEDDDRYPVYHLYVYQLTNTTRQEVGRPTDEYYRHAAYAFGECVQEARYAPRHGDSQPPGASAEPVNPSTEPVRKLAPAFEPIETPGMLSRLKSALLGGPKVDNFTVSRERDTGRKSRL